jgi:hypothetical protein
MPDSVFPNDTNERRRSARNGTMAMAKSRTAKRLKAVLMACSSSTVTGEALEDNSFAGAGSSKTCSIDGSPTLIENR